MNGLVIAAPRSASGKTTVTLGLVAALRRRGLAVAPAKSGPDYIDTAILARTAGRAALNLDAWAMSLPRLRRLASAHAADADLLLVEGAMGLFDGAADNRGSTADLAAALGLPVILVLDAERQSQSIAALAHGFATWRPDVTVAGLIVNRAASTRHEAMLRSALSALPIPLLGVIPKREVLVLPERQLGLVLPDEVARFDGVVGAAAEAMEDYVDLNRLVALSTDLAAAPPSPLRGGTEGGSGSADHRWIPTPNSSPQGGGGLPPLGQHIAIARDAAFAFLYPHWLRDWHAAGATLSFFSPLANEAPDPAADAVFLPGGYPELHGQVLARARSFHAGLHAARDRGALVYGECGGFMVLGRSITDKSGITHAMTGLLPHETRIDRPRRVLGYRRLSHASPLPFPTRLTGHEFHYSSARRTHGTPLFAAADALGEALPPMGLVEGRVMGSYAHVIDIA
ncbi:cobyrinate a,c-diamide synthase [Devosia sp.]|uniref:cobyrinate a,c-diamide synthase n=1 Tax=Devosia sp. TaxID=1871048 RepID=UPI001AC6A95B|nr:cobyrinate a,c-diamide synthase [Devosia sp.]MBN9308818.1 cobyrinate a,c-diamide synthase [Devosia sp.]